jgi:putative membrane protein
MPSDYHPMKREPLVLLVAAMALLVWSGVRPYDRTTWILETFPIMVAVPVLLWTARRFPLTPLAYRLVFVHAIILMLGGHYTYARVPLGFWMQDHGSATRTADAVVHARARDVPSSQPRTPLR